MSAVSGLLLFDKPSGPTSHDVVLWVRRVLRTPRVGHCGTLDPLAGGLLLVAVGEALKWQDQFTRERKTYRGSLRLGLSTDTDDLAGKILCDRRAEAAESGPTVGRVEEVFREFTGRFRQRVPRYSAARVNGRRLYEWARDGVEVALPVKEVEVYEFRLLSYAPPEAEFLAACSKGTYIRALARDVGERLGVGATLTSLCRESIGPFSRSEASAWRPSADFGAAQLQRCLLGMDRLREMFRGVAA